MKSSLISLSVGEKVRYDDGSIGVIKSITLKPNGMSDRRLVAVLCVEINGGRRVSATSDKFTDVETEEYKEHYPSDELYNKI